MFKRPPEGSIELCSVHRSKGATKKRVWLLVGDELLNESNVLADYPEEELNILYVALTRSEQQLMIVKCPTEIISVEEYKSHGPRATFLPREILALLPQNA